MTNAGTGSSNFSDHILNLCRTLEQWRNEERLIVEKDPNEFPETNWRIAGQGLLFLGLGGLVASIQSWMKFVQGFGTLGLYFLLIAICSGTALVLLFQAQGFFEPRFWRAARVMLKKTDNYPFTPLIRRTERDFAATLRLEPFSEFVLKTVDERLTGLESELKERLTLLGGSSPIPTFVGLTAGAWSAWTTLRGEVTVLAAAALAALILVLCLTGYSFRLRFSLFELTRCRGLLALEVARRKESGTS